MRDLASGAAGGSSFGNERSGGGPGGEWNATERECFKRFFLIYGYGRWAMMREAAKNVGYNIEDKPDEEMTQYANAFISTICEQLNSLESKEIKQFLVSLVESTQIEGVKIECNPAHWGAEVLLQRAAQWGKRIHMLFVVNRIC